MPYNRFYANLGILPFKNCFAKVYFCPLRNKPVFDVYLKVKNCLNKVSWPHLRSSTLPKMLKRVSTLLDSWFKAVCGPSREFKSIRPF